MTYNWVDPEKNTMMTYDCGFTNSNYWFRYRVGGFVVNQNRVLFVKSNAGDHFYMIGGGVHLGETSSSCIEREIAEESGIKAHARHLAVVCENFFKGRGGMIDSLDCHTIEFYYLMKIDDMSSVKEKTDIGEALVWLTIDEIKKNNIKPGFIRERIDEIFKTDQTIHIIEERDR